MPDLHDEFAAEPDLHASFASEPDAPHPVTSALTGALHGATLGFSDELHGAYEAMKEKWAGAQEPLDELYRKHRDSYRTMLSALSAANPKTFKASEIAGGLATAPFLPVGGAVKGAAAVGRAALTGAGLGAVSGLGDSKADLTQGDVAGAARDTATGAVLGAGVGAAAGAVPIVAQKGAQALRGFAAKEAVSALRPTAGEVKNLVTRDQLQKLGDSLLDRGLIKAGDRVESIADRLSQFKGEAGQRQGAAIEALDKTGAKLDTADIAAKFRALEAEAQAAGPGAAPLAAKFGEAAKAVELHPSSTLSFAEGELWKKGFQDRVNYGRANPSAAQQGDEALASAVRQAVEEAAERTSGPAAEAFKAAKGDYGMAARAEGLTEGALARKEARNILSPSDKAVAATGLLTGHPIAGVAGALANKLVRERAASTLAVGARGASDRLAQIAAAQPQRLGKYGALLAGALQRSPDEFNAHVFVLGQTDPSFQALQKQLAEEK